MSERIKGTKLAFIVHGVEIRNDATSVVLDNEEAEGDVTTFADAEAGGARQEFLQFGAVQSTQVGSFWRTVHANPGLEAPFVFKPHGNEVPTPDKPHFRGVATFGPKPTLGGEAGAQSTFTFETRMDLVGASILDDGTDGEPLISSVDGVQPFDPDDTVIFHGVRFLGTTNVTVDGISAPFAIVHDGALAVGIPGAADGPANVIVTNAEGASPAFSITVT